MPMMMVLVGNSVDAFNSPDLDSLYNDACRQAKFMVILGVASFFSHGCMLL